MPRFLLSIPSTEKTGLCDLLQSRHKGREAEASSEGQGHPLSHGKFKTSLGFIKICLKINNTNHASKQTTQLKHLGQVWARWAEPAVSQSERQLQRQLGTLWRAPEPVLAQAGSSSKACVEFRMPPVAKNHTTI